MPKDKGIPGWMKASSGKDDRKVDRIPTNDPGEYLDIEYWDLPFGVKVWDTVDSEMAALERDLKRKKKEASLTIGAVEAEEMYHKALLRKMEIDINGERVKDTFYDTGVNQAGFRFLQKWIKHKIENEPFPKPTWLVEDEDQKTPITPSGPGEDQVTSSGPGGE